MYLLKFCNYTTIDFESGSNAKIIQYFNITIFLLRTINIYITSIKKTITVFIYSI